MSLPKRFRQKILRSDKKKITVVATTNVAKAVMFEKGTMPIEDIPTEEVKVKKKVVTAADAAYVGRKRT